MKRISLLLLASIFLILSCATKPQPAETSSPAVPAPPVVTAQPAEPTENTPPPEPPPQVVEPTAPSNEAVFDPASITEEKFATTKADVQTLIEDLNKLIKARNYNAWRTYLADSYFEEISSKAFLDERTDDLYKRDQIVDSNLGKDPRRTQKKILRTPKDYFDNVVVPSRSNDRMDDIDFVSENRVKAYTMDNHGHRLVLYDLELINGKWMIIN